MRDMFDDPRTLAVCCATCEFYRDGLCELTGEQMQPGVPRNCEKYEERWS